MSDIPPALPSSAAQTGFQAREVAKERDARRVGQDDAVSRRAKSVTEADVTVDTTDSDTAVYADAEGAGSQGSPFEESGTNEEESSEEQTDENGVTKGEDGQLHIDFQA